MKEGSESLYLSNPNPEATDKRATSLWERVLELVEQDLSERCSRKLFVEVQDESGTSCHKEVGELSASERQSLHPILREQVVERLLDRYLAEQGRVDLADKRRAYSKKIEDLTPQDLPALIEADRQRAEEERQEEREQAEFVREAQADLEQLLVVDHTEKKMTKAGNGLQR